MVKRLSYSFKGVMVPVLTPFNNDEKRSINFDLIDPYAHYLQSNGIKGILVNGTTGEGTSMSVAERKELAEVWKKASEKYHFNLMIQIGGCPMVDACELAKHAQDIKADAVLCLPELYLRPRSERVLCDYMMKVSKYCLETPFLYYHIPMFTGVNVSLPLFLDMAEKEMPNFVGCKYTSGDLAQGVECLKAERSVFLGCDQALIGGLALGFDSTIMMSLNIWPSMVTKMMDLMEKGDIKEARVYQLQLNDNLKSLIVAGNTPGGIVKLAFQQRPEIGLDFGPCRCPERM